MFGALVQKVKIVMVDAKRAEPDDRLAGDDLAGFIPLGLPGPHQCFPGMLRRSAKRKVRR